MPSISNGLNMKMCTCGYTITSKSLRPKSTGFFLIFPSLHHSQNKTLSLALEANRGVALFSDFSPVLIMFCFQIFVVIKTINASSKLKFEKLNTF